MEAVGTVTSSPKHGGRTLARTVDQAGTGAHEAIDKVSDAARPVVDRIASGAHQAVDQLASAAGGHSRREGRAISLKNAQVRAMEQSRGYVRDHPVASLGIAVAAGFLLSRLVSWRSR